MRNRIKILLGERGWQNDDLAERLGAHTTTVSRLINERLPLSEEWLTRLAAAFAIPPSEVIAEPAGVRKVDVRVLVEVGAWRDNSQLPSDDCYSVPIPEDQALAGVTLVAAEVRGASMNRRYSEGTVIVFNNMAETGEALRDGSRYVIERRRGDGMRETSVKTLWRDEAGKMWLLPESTDPRYQEPVPLDSAGDVTVRIIGRVLYAVQREL